MSMKDLINHGFVIKEYGYDLYSIAKAYEQLSKKSKNRQLYLKDLKRYSDNISDIAHDVSEIIANEILVEEKSNRKH